MKDASLHQSVNDKYLFSVDKIKRPPALMRGRPGPLLLKGDEPVGVVSPQLNVSFDETCSLRADPDLIFPRGRPRFPPVLALHRFGPSFSPRKSTRGEVGRVSTALSLSMSTLTKLSTPPSLSLDRYYKTFFCRN